MEKEKRKSLTPQRVNIFGRKWYPKNSNAMDYMDSCFDDIWSAIIALWLAITIMMSMTFHYFKTEDKKS